MAAASLQFPGAVVLRVSLCISYAYFCVLRGSIRYCCHFLLCIVYAFLNSIVKWTIGLYKTMEFTIFVQVSALVVFWSLPKQGKIFMCLSAHRTKWNKVKFCCKGSCYRSVEVHCVKQKMLEKFKGEVW